MWAFLPISNEAFAVSFVSLQEVVYIFTAEQQFNFLLFNLHEHLDYKFTPSQINQYYH